MSENNEDGCKKYYDSVLREMGNCPSSNVFVGYIEDMSDILEAFLKEEKEKENKEEDEEITDNSNEIRDYFCSKILPNAIEMTLRHHYEGIRGENGRDYAIKATHFIQKSSELIISFIPSDSPFCLLECISKIFSRKKSLYWRSTDIDVTLPGEDSDNGSDSDDEANVHRVSTPHFATLPAKEKATFGHVIHYSLHSPLLVHVIDNFARFGGFDAIIRRINSTNPCKVPLHLLKMYIRVFSKVSSFFTPNAAVRFCGASLYSPAFELLLHLSDNELRPMEKNDLERIVHHVQTIIRSVPGSTLKSASEITEKFCLAFALRCFTCQMLEKRIHGLDYIQDMAEMAERASLSFQHQHSFHHQHSPHQTCSRCYPEDYWDEDGWPGTSKWVDVEFMITWLSENQVLEELFSKNPHEALIAESDKLVEFLARRDSLSEYYIDLIWDAAMKRGEAVRNAAQEVLVSISSFKSNHLYLLRKLVDIPPSQFPPKFIKLLADSTRTPNPEVRNTAISMLWDLMLDHPRPQSHLDGPNSYKPDPFGFRPTPSGAVSHQIQISALNALKDRTIQVADSSSLKLIEWCLNDHIPVHFSVPQCLLCIRTLLDNLSPHFDTKRQWLASLQNEFQIHDMLIEEICTFSWQQHVSTPLHSRVDHIKIRLDFIGFLYNSSSISPSFSVLNRLWDRFVEASHDHSDVEMEVALQWFAELPALRKIEPSLLSRLFSQLISQMDFGSLTRTGLRCFRLHFENVNDMKSGSLEEDFQSPSNFHGYDELWKLCTTVQNADVHEDAVRWLIDLHSSTSEHHHHHHQQQQQQRKHDPEQPLRPTHHRLFLEKCLSIIEEITDCESVDSSRSLVASRCISLIKELLGATPAPSTLRMHDRGQLMRIKIVNHLDSTKGDTLPHGPLDGSTLPHEVLITLYGGDSVSNLKGEICRAFRNSAQAHYNSSPKSGADGKVETEDTDELLSHLIPSLVNLSLSERCGPPAIPGKTHIPDESRAYQAGLRDQCSLSFTRQQKQDSSEDNEHPESPPDKQKHPRNISRYDNPPDYPDVRRTQRTFGPPSPEEKMKVIQIIEFIQLNETAALIALRKADGFLETCLNSLLDETNPTFMNSVLEEAGRIQEEEGSHLSGETDSDDEEKKKQRRREAEKECPAWILAIDENKRSFPLLFRLLEEGVVPEDRVWEILKNIPTDPSLLSRLGGGYYAVHHFDEQDVDSDIQEPIDWSFLLDASTPRRIPQLLYTLQSMEHLLLGSNDFEDFSLEPVESKRRITWSKNFLYGDGFANVFQLFVTAQEYHDSYKSKEAWRACLPILLRIVDTFFQTDSSVLEDLQSKTFYSFPRRSLRHSGETLKKKVDFTSFVKTLTATLQRFARDQDPQAVTSSLSLLFTVLSTHPDLLPQFYSFPDSDSLILSLLTSPHPTIASVSSASFLRLCEHSEHSVQPRHLHPCAFFLPILRKNLEKLETLNPPPVSTYYYSLLGQLVALSLKTEQSPSSEFFHLLTELVSLLFLKLDQPPLERHADGVVDFLLVGLFELLATLAATSPDFKHFFTDKDIPLTVFRNFLFAEEASNICKTHTSRSAAFQFLSEMCKDHFSNFTQVVHLLSPHHVESVKELTSWSNPKVKEKSRCGFVGLENLGATCYANGLLQQFFMIPAMHDSILRLDLSQAEPDNLLLQLQNMFAYLQASEMQYFETGDFARAFTDLEGNPMNTHFQQDAYEFFNILCLHLEELTKNTPLLADTFAGTLTNEYVSQECQHHFERSEDFYAISINIKRKRDLQSALEDFVQGEVLEGESAYKCEKCDKKIKAIRRTTIKKMAPTLIIHLKRFEYLVDRQSNRKISDHFEFPLTLDVGPFLHKDAPPTPEYKLVGILVHSGHADSGHYYSFIRERAHGHPKLQDETTGNWFRFDDKNVVEFDMIRNLSDECFGGKETVHYTSISGFASTRKQSKLKSAYMLFYEADYPRDTGTAPIPPHLYGSITRQNKRCARDRQLFDPEYFNFLWELMKNAETLFQKNSSSDEIQTPTNPSTALTAFQLSTYFTFETLLRVSEKEDFANWIGDVILPHLKSHPSSCHWFLSTIFSIRRSWFRHLLLESNQPVREKFSSLLITAFETLSPDPGQDYMVPFLEMMEFTRQHWRRFEEYWKVLLNYASIGNSQRRLLIEKGLLGSLVDYYMGPFSPRSGSNRVRLGGDSGPIKIRNLLKCLVVLIQSHCPNGAANEGNLPPTALPGTSITDQFTKDDKEMLFNRHFWGSFLKQGYDAAAPLDAITHLVWEDQQRSDWIFEMILKGFAEFHAPDYLFRAIEAQLKVRDSLDSWRISSCFSFEDGYGLVDFIHSNRSYYNFACTCLEKILQFITRFELVAKWFYSSRKKWSSWVDSVISKRIDALQCHLYSMSSDIVTQLKEVRTNFHAFSSGTLKLDFEYQSGWESADPS